MPVALSLVQTRLWLPSVVFVLSSPTHLCSVFSFPLNELQIAYSQESYNFTCKENT